VKRRTFLIASVFLLPGAVSAADTRVTAAPGRVARVRLGKADEAPKAYLDGARLLVEREPNEWVALAGIPLSAKVRSTLSVEVAYAGERRETRAIRVVSRKYAVQHLSVAPDQAELPPEQLERYEQEREHLKQVLRTFTEAGPASLALKPPVEGRRSGTFGLRRVINGMVRNPHGGMDIAAPEGTPIAAAAAGRVLDTGEYLFLGRTVVLDHGQGLLSLYAHMSEVAVSAGDTLAASATIGKVGMTGRATGPHVHFSVYLNATAVDPAIFLPAPK
jgi:murein DD-endopeptidase MepM/ murein hydrolase activator NlpD